MPKLGIKVGLKGWRNIPWPDITAEACEIHFRIDWQDQYAPLFRFLRSQDHLTIGLHFWGTLADDVLPSFAVSDAGVRAETMQLIRKCIEIASRHNLAYVVIHPGPRKICRLSLATGRLEVTRMETPASESCELFLANAMLLHEYAMAHGVRLVVETETRRKPEISFSETEFGGILDAGDQDIQTLATLGRAGVSLCVDFAHLTTWFADSSLYRWDLLQAMLDYLRQVQPHVYLVHVASVQPPFLIDTTNGLTDAEIAMGVFPNRAETMALLRVALSEDLIIVPEPRLADHAYHNALLHTMLQDIAVEDTREAKKWT